jgi:hypothetical protein
MKPAAIQCNALSAMTLIECKARGSPASALHLFLIEVAATSEPTQALLALALHCTHAAGPCQWQHAAVWTALLQWINPPKVQAVMAKWYGRGLSAWPAPRRCHQDS